MLEDEDSEAGHTTELGDMEVEAGYERFGVAEIQEIVEDATETDSSARMSGL